MAGARRATHSRRAPAPSTPRRAGARKASRSMPLPTMGTAEGGRAYSRQMEDLTSSLRATGTTPWEKARRLTALRTRWRVSSRARLWTVWMIPTRRPYRRAAGSTYSSTGRWVCTTSGEKSRICARSRSTVRGSGPLALFSATTSMPARLMSPATSVSSPWRETTRTGWPARESSRARWSTIISAPPVSRPWTTIMTRVWRASRSGPAPGPAGPTAASGVVASPAPPAGFAGFSGFADFAGRVSAWTIWPKTASGV